MAGHKRNPKALCASMLDSQVVSSANLGRSEAFREESELKNLLTAAPCRLKWFKEDVVAVGASRHPRAREALLGGCMMFSLSS